MVSKLQRYEVVELNNGGGVEVFAGDEGDLLDFRDVEALLEEFIKMYSDAVAAQRFRHGVSVERVYALEEVADMAAKALGR